MSVARGAGGAEAPVRLVHLGLGSFFRAHQAWYTDRAPDAETWGIAAFTGRSRGLTDVLSAQEGLYTLVTRAADGDRFDVVGSISSVHGADDHAAWLRHLASPDVAAATITITGVGYLRRADGALDGDQPGGSGRRRDPAPRSDRALSEPLPVGYSRVSAPGDAPTPGRLHSSRATISPTTVRWSAAC